MKKSTIEGISFVLLLAVLGVLNFGWVFYPTLGMVAGGLNAAIIIGIVIIGIAVRFFRGKEKL